MGNEARPAEEQATELPSEELTERLGHVATLSDHELRTFFDREWRDVAFGD